LYLGLLSVGGDGLKALRSQRLVLL
jgi:hypothetical protein